MVLSLEYLPHQVMTFALVKWQAKISLKNNMRNYFKELIQLDPSNELSKLGVKPITQPQYYNFHYNFNFSFNI